LFLLLLMLLLMPVLVLGQIDIQRKADQLKTLTQVAAISTVIRFRSM
jgi:hypothetical protein